MLIEAYFDVCFCRSAIDSSLFKQWLHNLQTENGILANGTMTLNQVLIQVIRLFSNKIYLQNCCKL